MRFRRSGTVLCALTLAMVGFGGFAHGTRVKRKTEPPKRTAAPPKPKRAPREPYTERIATTPDINQHMTIGQFLKQIPPSEQPAYTPPSEIPLSTRVFEQNYCAPAAVADHLVWLDVHHFQQISSESDPVIAGVALAKILGEAEYMKTMSQPAADSYDLPVGEGTTYEDLVRGAVNFLAAKKIPIKQVTIFSVWTPPERRSAFGLPLVPMEIERRAPTFSEMTRPLRRRTIVVHHFGHYRYQVEDVRDGKVIPDYLERTGGHWISPVGFDGDKSGNLAPGTVIYHDPAGGDQDKKTQVYHPWIRQTGPYHDLPLRQKKDPKYPELACKDDANWTCLGRLSGTYVRDKPIEQYAGGEPIEVLEGVVVIEL